MYIVLESGNVLESDSSPYFEDSDSDSDLDPEDSDSDSDSNPMTWSCLEVFRILTQYCRPMTWN